MIFVGYMVWRFGIPVIVAILHVALGGVSQRHPRAPHSASAVGGCVSQTQAGGMGGSNWRGRPCRIGVV